MSAQTSLFEARSARRPFLRWAGGKTRLLRHLRPHFPADFAGYYEPFLGGGAVFFDICARASDPTVLADLNPELINCWVRARDQPKRLYEAVSRYMGMDNEEAYYAVRDGEEPTTAIGRAARFLYLNQTAWNGLWRVNRRGRFNVPWGDRPFRGITEAELLELSSALEDVDIRLADFRDVLEEPQAGDFVYLDPPYLPLSDTSKFYLYTEKRFRQPDLVVLGEICERLSEEGVYWILSNRDTPLVREIFSHSTIVSLTTRRSVAAQNRRDVELPDSPEAIVIGGPTR
ncbi:MAG TPA: DNA adenine methylase [Solirubrobacteraceae bacterium]|jgi:DNA adenine methylase|nr:DNA adenine methylase [Solirubrobacteraceae bacterium]